MTTSPRPIRACKLLAVGGTALLLTATACTSSESPENASAADAGTSAAASSDDSSADAADAPAKEPQRGVPPDTDPMPMPEPGKRYDNPQPRSKIKKGGTLRLAIAEIPPNFNGFSVDGNTVYNEMIDAWTSPTLWDFSVGGTPEPNPNYLSSVTLLNKHPETVRYVINPEATWNNGDPITWKAFKTTWTTQSGKSGKYNPSATAGYSSIKSVKPGKNPKTAIVTFAEPFYPYQTLFGSLEHPKNADPKFYKKGWVGDAHNELRAGPFKVASVTDTTVVLKRNPNWWGKPAKLDKVVYRQMESTASINAFRNGEIDATAVGNAERMEQIRDMEGILVRRGYGIGVALYRVGQGSELFSHLYARKAFAFGTNRKQLMQIRFQGMDWDAEPPGSINLYPWMDLYENNLSWLHYDPEKATSLMREHGWTMGDDGYFHKDGKVAQFTFVKFGDDATGTAIARAQQAMSKKVGLKMKIKSVKSSNFSKTMMSGAFDIVLMSWVQSDPFGFVWNCQFYCSDSESNYSDIGTKAVDKKLRKAGSIPNLKKAAHAGNQAEAAALKLMPAIPLWNGPEVTAVRKGLANWGPSGWLDVHRANVGWMKSTQ